MLTFFPPEVAPNILTLAGFLCVLHATYLTYTTYGVHPHLTTFINICLLFAYQTLDALDGKQARKIKNSSPLGELFDHVCDSLSVVFIILIVCWTYEVKNLWIQWLIIQSVQIVFMWTHLIAFFNLKIEFDRWTGPGEIQLAVLGFLGLRWFNLQEMFEPLHTHFWAIPFLSTTWISLSIGVCIYSLVWCYIFQPNKKIYKSISYYEPITKNYISTCKGLMICFFFRFIASVITYRFVQLDTIHVICDGIFWSLVTGDLILAKMSDRDLHPWIPIFAMVSVLHPWLILASCIYYFTTVFTSLCHELNISMFNVNHNVYVDGVYDLCHLGHKTLFSNALKLGDRLIVGVLDDVDVEKYKRKPIMNLAERVAAVKACRDVSEVIAGSPANGLSKEFLEKYNIHIVAHSPEYDREDDHYYKVPRELGITKVLPYTDSISTSQLIERIKNRTEQVYKNGPIRKSTDHLLQILEDNRQMFEDHKKFIEACGKFMETGDKIFQNLDNFSSEKMK